MITFPPTLAVFWADLLRIKWLPLDIGNDDDDDDDDDDEEEEEEDDDDEGDDEGTSRLEYDVDQPRGKLDGTGGNDDDGDDEFDVDDDNKDGDNDDDDDDDDAFRDWIDGCIDNWAVEEGSRSTSYSR